MRPEDTDPGSLLNSPEPRPVLDFFVQGGIALALLVALVYGIFSAGLWLGPLIPFAWEKQVSALALRDYPISTQGPEAEARRATLQRLADALVPYEHLPKDEAITINYSADNTVNAFTTLGGNVVVYEGLIERLPTENALSMVIGHEIGHAKHRDPIRFMSGEQLVKLVVGLATGDSDLAHDVVSNIQLLTSLTFSREAEERADLAGLTALEGHYGHVNGYRQTFDALESYIREQGGHGTEPPEFLRDHPDTAVRLAKLEAYAKSHHWSEEGQTTPLRQANYPPISFNVPAPSDALGLAPSVKTPRPGDVSANSSVDTKTTQLQPDN